MIRTCTVSKLLDSDSSHSSFTLKMEDNTEFKIVSGLIASCKDDGCNKSSFLTSVCFLIILSQLLSCFLNYSN